MSPNGLARYLLVPSSSEDAGSARFEHLSSVELFNAGSAPPTSDSRFRITAHSDDESQQFVLENAAYALTFSAELGHLKVCITDINVTFRIAKIVTSIIVYFCDLQKIKHKASNAEIDAKMQFIAYGTSTGSSRSGAYMFLPDGEAHVQSRNAPPVFVARGALVSEAHVSYSSSTERQSAHAGGPRSFVHLIRHQVVRVYANAAEREALEVENLVDLRAGNNVELGLRIATSVASRDTFYTDQNCFQVCLNVYLYGISSFTTTNVYSFLYSFRKNRHNSLPKRKTKMHL